MIAISAIISQAQIRHRSYFYKTSVLVREGILVLHGDELGADLTQASHLIGNAFCSFVIDERGAELAQTLAEIDRRMLDFVVGLDTEFSELMDGSHL